MKGIKIENSSDFWYFYEDGEYGNWYFECNTSIDYTHYYDYYINCFIKLTHKYGILLPFINFKLKEFGIVSIEEYIKKKENENKFGLINLYSGFYENNIDFTRTVFPSNLYVYRNNNIVLRSITDLNNTDILDSMDYKGNPPIKLLGTGQYNKTILPITHIVLRTDAFFQTLHNKNVANENLYSRNDLTKYKNARIYGIDNSELAYLNTPRFNSFLRDVTKLNEFCGGEIKFEGWDENINKKGILFQGEIIYYEDIHDLLPEEHKYKPFEEIQIELDDTNYKKWLEKKQK